MNKMVKGTFAIGAGALLLLGGGGTLAAWNADQTAQMGTIQAGNLNLTAGQGIWTSNLMDAPVNLTTHKIIPGETLTYKQNLDVVLEGNAIKAKLSVDGKNGKNVLDAAFVDGTINKPEVTLAKEGVDLTNVLSKSVEGITASVSFTFNADTARRQSVNAKYDFSNVAFKLEQVTPTPVR